jgi:hypothetical protein
MARWRDDEKGAGRRHKDSGPLPNPDALPSQNELMARLQAHLDATDERYTVGEAWTGLPSPRGRRPPMYEGPTRRGAHRRREPWWAWWRL